MVDFISYLHVIDLCPYGVQHCELRFEALQVLQGGQFNTTAVLPSTAIYLPHCLVQTQHLIDALDVSRRCETSSSSECITPILGCAVHDRLRLLLRSVPPNPDVIVHAVASADQVVVRSLLVGGFTFCWRLYAIFGDFDCRNIVPIASLPDGCV